MQEDAVGNRPAVDYPWEYFERSSDGYGR